MEESLAEKIFDNFRRDYLFYFSRILNKVLVCPDMIQIMLTSRCNIRCRICDVWKQNFNDELTTSEVKKLISQAIDLGVKTIYFTGGEALLREDIFELVDFASRPGVVTTVNTNGSLITDDLAKKIVLSKLRNITFSIDSHLPQIHNSIRGKNVFEMAIRAIEAINRYKKEFNREAEDGEDKRLDIAMVSVIMKLNIKELPGMVELAQKMRCCYLAFQPLIYNGNLLDNLNVKSEFWVDSDDIIALENIFREMEHLKREKKPDISIDFMPEKTIQHFKREWRVNTCFAGFNRIFVNPKGDMSFVCFESFGNIKKDDLKDAWLSDKACLLREKIRSCNVNCTQFCSERPQSEDIRQIHSRLSEQINNFSSEDKNMILDKERSFFQEIYKETKSDINIKNTEADKVYGELEKISSSIISEYGKK